MSIYNNVFIISDWTTLSVYETEFVHDIIESDDDHYEDEDDSNGRIRTSYVHDQSHHIKGLALHVKLIYVLPSC